MSTLLDPWGLAARLDALAARLDGVADEVGALRARVEAERDALLDHAGLAVLLGAPSAAAAKQRVRRDPELARIALRVGARPRWRRSAVLALLEARAAAGRGRNRRALDGGDDA